MFSIRTAALPLVLVAMVGGFGPAQAATEEYSVAQGDHVAICEGEEVEEGTGLASPANVGGVCFHWAAGKATVRITFNDLVSGEHVGFYYQWYNAQDDFITGSETDPVTGEPEAIFGTACSPATVPVISGARGMKIWLDQAFGPLDCDADPPGVATTGTVTAS